MRVLVALLMFHVSACGRSDPRPDTPTAGAGSPPTEAADGTNERAGAATIAETRPRLGEVRVGDLTPAPIRPEGIADAVDPIVKAALATDFERAANDDPRACRATIGIGYALLVNRTPVRDADAGEARAFFEGELYCPGATAKPDDVDAFRIKLDASRDFGGVSSGGTGKERLQEALTQVVGDGVAALYGQWRMRRATDAELRRALGDGTATAAAHPGVLAEAASEAGERHLIDLAPTLARLTAHANPRVATRAGAALGQLKVATPEVIAALVKMTEGPDPERHLVAIHALADLGTPEAQRYLEALAVGHPSPALREVARQRLRELGAVLPEGPEGPAPEPVPDPVP